MTAVELRDKLIKQFSRFIQDDSKLLVLDGIFDAMNVADVSSVIPEDHYKIVEERRKQLTSGKVKGLSWDNVRKQLKQKYGF